MKNKLIIIVGVLLCSVGCGKKNPAPEPPPITPNTTSKAILIAPAENELCTTGVQFTSQTSVVTFKWNASTFADNYTIIIKNLLTSEISTRVITTTQTEFTINRNTPYSWYIKTKSSLNSDIIESAVWKFYNAGAATSSYAPYPADLNAPTMDQNVPSTNGSIILRWTGSDVDNNILNYDIYFGTNANPPLIKSGHTTATYTAAIAPLTKYYWKIVSRDATGNTSESSIYQFITL